MTNFYTQVTLEHDSALPEDRSVNVWSLWTDGLDDATYLTAWHNALVTFYGAIDLYLSSALGTTGTIKSYNRADPTPRVPDLSTDLTLVPGATASAAELALCVSFQGDRLAGASQARRRGRVYLGPLVGTMVDTSTGRPNTGSVAAIQAAADALLTTSLAAAGWYWAVWSEVNGSAVEVTNGWIDNAFDVQRRRGLRPTSRVLFS